MAHLGNPEEGKYLEFSHHGETFRVSLEEDTYGHIFYRRAGDGTEFHFGLPHPQWRIIGFSKSHLETSPSISLSDVERDPKKAEKTLVWDVDHGTTRRWGGMWRGKVPRVEGPTVKEFVGESTAEIAGVGVSRGPVGEYIVWALGPARERLYKLYESKAHAKPRAIAHETVSLAEEHGVPIKYAPSEVAEIVREIRAS